MDAKQTGFDSSTGSHKRLPAQHSSAPNPSLVRDGQLTPASSLGGDHTPHGTPTKGAQTGPGNTTNIS